jgi:hypothetical protein
MRFFLADNRNIEDLTFLGADRIRLQPYHSERTAEFGFVGFICQQSDVGMLAREILEPAEKLSANQGVSSFNVGEVGMAWGLEGRTLERGVSCAP